MKMNDENDDYTTTIRFDKNERALIKTLKRVTGIKNKSDVIRFALKTLHDALVNEHVIMKVSVVVKKNKTGENKIDDTEKEKKEEC